MQPSDLALLHAAAFLRPPPWSAAAFESLLADPTTKLLTTPDRRAFLLGRIVADEAEILTVATHPEARRKGHARGLVLRFLEVAQRCGAAQAYLDVAEDNAPARALYADCGFAFAGRRPGYYRDAHGTTVAALLLSRRLNDAAD